MASDADKKSHGVIVRLGAPFALFVVAVIVGQTTGLTRSSATTSAKPVAFAPQGNPLPLSHKRLSQLGHALQLRQLQVERGSEAAATAYYQDAVVPQIKLLTRDTILKSTIKDLFSYFGYPNMAASDIHRLPSDQIMALSPGDILATRFFAPKITEVGTPSNAIPPAPGFGWRKLVRLRAKAGSQAESNGIESLLLLQNIFEPTVAGDPFDATKNVSKFNQAIAVRRDGPFSDLRHSLYFFAYGPLVKTQLVNGKEVPLIDGAGKFQDNGPLTVNLAATFDARDPESGQTAKLYFIPDSCAQCHGRTVQRAKVNFLDTDHWIDRVKPDYSLPEDRFQQDDFTALAGSNHAVLYDAGNNETAVQFKAAFQVIRQLNQEISDQNSRLGTAGNFQLVAVQKWLDLHKPEKFDQKHAPPPQRGIGTQTWDPNNESHRKLVYYLNRYCYRCHSSIKYNVFDFAAVKSRASLISSRVLDIEDPTNWMPQDRIFPGLEVDPQSGGGAATGALKEFLELLASLNNP